MKSLSLVFLLFLVSNLTAQFDSKANETKIFIRYENLVGAYRIGEDLVGLTETKGNESVAIRVCSNQTFPEALLKTVADPFLIAEKLTNDFAFPPKNIYFLLSKDCLTDKHMEAVEIWLISNKLDYPPSEKIINSTQVTLSPLGNNISNRGMQDYKTASEKILMELKSNKDSFGVIKGYYLQKPSQLLEKRINEIEFAFEKNNVSTDKYTVSLEPLLDEVSTYPKDKEPIYPNIYLLTILPNLENQSRFLVSKNKK